MLQSHERATQGRIIRVYALQHAFRIDSAPAQGCARWTCVSPAKRSAVRGTHGELHDLKRLPLEVLHHLTGLAMESTPPQKEPEHEVPEGVIPYTCEHLDHSCFTCGYCCSLAGWCFAARLLAQTLTDYVLEQKHYA